MDWLHSNPPIPRRRLMVSPSFASTILLKILRTFSPPSWIMSKLSDPYYCRVDFPILCPTVNLGRSSSRNTSSTNDSPPFSAYR